MSEPHASEPLVDRLSFGILMIVASSVAFGMVPFFARSLTEAGIAAPAVAFFRYILTPLLLFRFIVLTGPGRIATLWGISSGMLLGIGWVGYVRSLALMPVSTAGILYMTYPMFTLVAGWLIFRDPFSIRSIVASIMVLIGAVVAAAPAATGDVPVQAYLFAFAAPLAFGISINILTHKLIVLPPLSRMSLGPLGASLVLVPMMATYPVEQVLPQDLHTAFLLVAIGLITSTGPTFIYSTFGPKIGAANTAIAGAGELPTMMLVGWLAFGEALTLKQMLAALIILSAITLTGARRARNIATTTAVPKPPVGSTAEDAWLETVALAEDDKQA